MVLAIRLCLAAILGTLSASAQQAPPAKPRTIHLNVSVGSKTGIAAAGLQQQNFTLFDNKSPHAISLFQAVTKTQEHVEVIILLDSANMRFTSVSYAKMEVQKFLRANDGHLNFPTTLAILADSGTQIEPGFSTDGNALSDSLEHQEIGLRQLNRTSGIYGADERRQLSLTALQQLVARAGPLPGRKIILWISPGWPLLSGPGIDLTNKQHDAIFRDIVDLSAHMREGNITLYNIDPLGPGEDLVRENYYRDFEKGISKPNQTDLGNLSLQVLSVQSGGLAMQSSSDVAGMLKRCVAELDAWYEITIKAAPAEKPNEYHHLEVRVDQAGLLIRTRDGYYAQP